MRANTIKHGSKLKHPGKGVFCFSVHPEKDPLFAQIKTLEIYIAPPGAKKTGLNFNINENGAKLLLASEEILSIDREKIPFFLEDNQFKSRHTFWLNINYFTRRISVGHGEPSLQTRADEIFVENKKLAQHLEKLSDLQIFFNNSDYEITEKCHPSFAQLGSEDPARLGDNFKTLDELSKSSVLHIDSAPNEIRDLYNRTKDCTLDSVQVNGKPWLFLPEAIQESVMDPNGLLHKLLQAKRKKKNSDVLSPMELQYLRIQMKEGKGDAPGGGDVLEIWPPGHGSIPHRHAECYGIIKVLRGTLHVENFSTLSENCKVMKTTAITTVNKGQTVCLTPLQYQTHSVWNAEPIVTISLQCYKHPKSSGAHVETFHYIDQADGKIKEFKPESDISWSDFVRLLFEEYNARRPVMKYHPQVNQPIQIQPLPPGPIEEEKLEEAQVRAQLQLAGFPQSTQYQAQIQAEVVSEVNGFSAKIKVKNTSDKSLPSNSIVTFVVGRKSYTKQMSELQAGREETKTLRLGKEFAAGQNNSSIFLLHKAETGSYERVGDIVQV